MTMQSKSGKRGKSGKSWKGSAAKPKPEGQFRLSQAVLTYGPGSMVDLVGHAVVVREIDKWEGAGEVIHEDRLRRAILGAFAGEEPRLSLNPSAPFRTPPIADEREPRREHGISAALFPRWFVCQNPRCRRLFQLTPGGSSFDGKVTHSCHTGTGKAVPVRFVATCNRGHLGEFPWRMFAHAGSDAPCAAAELYLHEGATGDFSEITVECKACGHIPQKLSGAMRKDTKIPCGGQRVWMGAAADEACSERFVLMVRTASNSYFPMAMGALSIPQLGDRLWADVVPLADTIRHYDAAILQAMLAADPRLAPLKAYPAADVLATRDKIVANEGPAQVPLKSAEFATFMAAPAYAAGTIAPEEDDFFAQTLHREPASGASGASSAAPTRLGHVVLVSKLREVRALCGFTRVLPPVASLEGGYEGGVSMARISRTMDWLPATEIFGEGVFFSLSEPALQAWEKRAPVKRREAELERGFQAYLANLPEKARKPEFYGARFYLLHSLAHLVMTQMALRSGYAASAVRERIYCSRPGDADKMAGVLLSTGASGSEGTLGGLAQEAHRLGEHLRAARRAGELCSYDPVCAHHAPHDLSERFLEGAACHGCLFVAECSCEWFNHYLDRALVFPTIGHEDLAFFGGDD